MKRNIAMKKKEMMQEEKPWKQESWIEAGHVQ